MKFSVIVPVYNVQDYLGECIESVIKQTYQNFEIILVDDGSTDQSGSICDQYALLYPLKIKVVHAKNGGPFRARLIGMKEAGGDFLLFLDSDDCLRKDSLEKIFDGFVYDNCDMILFDAGECDKFPTIQIKNNLSKGSIFEGASKKEMYYNLIRGFIPNSVCLKAVRTECAKIPEHYYCCEVKNGEDLLLSAHLMTYCQKIKYIDEALYHYRNRVGSAVHTFNTSRKESIKFVHTELGKYIDQWGIPELKPLHNARKVRGWVYDVELLMRNRKKLGRLIYRQEVKRMSTDPYFRSSYKAMARGLLSPKDRLLAFCLYHRVLG